MGSKASRMYFSGRSKEVLYIVDQNSDTTSQAPLFKTPARQLVLHMPVVRLPVGPPLLPESRVLHVLAVTFGPPTIVSLCPCQASDEVCLGHQCRALAYHQVPLQSHQFLLGHPQLPSEVLSPPSSVESFARFTASMRLAILPITV